MIDQPTAGRDFHQHRQPFDLPEEVTFPDGRRFSGNRARVYWLLRFSDERSFEHPVGRHRAPAGWVPDFLFLEPWAGGSEGKRRLRELREYGIRYEHHRFVPGGDQTSNTEIYRLTKDPLRRRQIETRPTADKPKKARFRLPPLGTEAATVVESLKIPTGKLVFWTARASHPVGPNPICLSPGSAPGRHFLVPDAHTTCVGDYLPQLKFAWSHRPEFQQLVESGREVTFWVHPGLGFDPLETVTEALCRCGARHQGEWRTEAPE